MAVVRLLLSVTDVLSVIQHVSLVHSLILSIRPFNTFVRFLWCELHQARYLASYIDVLERRQIYSPRDIYQHNEFGTMHIFPDLIFLLLM